MKFKAFQLEVQISTDKVNFELIHKGFIPFTDKAVFNLDGLKKARYIKLTAEGYTYFHLHKIEVLIDETKNDDTCQILDPSLCVGGGGEINQHNSRAFYIGSCRYMPLFPNHFPARLHSTKEIIQYLHNYNRIDLKINDINYIFGNICHRMVIADSFKYCQIQNSIFDRVDSVVLEITTRKIRINNNLIYNNFYCERDKYRVDLPLYILTDDDIATDLNYIKHFVNIFLGIRRMIVISHIDLLLDDTNYIRSRHELKLSLQKICADLNIEFIDMTKTFSEVQYFKEVAPDFKHFSENGRIVAYNYINNYLQQYNCI